MIPAQGTTTNEKSKNSSTHLYVSLEVAMHNITSGNAHCMWHQIIVDGYQLLASCTNCTINYWRSGLSALYQATSVISQMGGCTKLFLPLPLPLR